MTLLGIDVSHHQEDTRRVDFGAVRAAGYRFAILKATEGSTYVDPTFAAMRARARAAGLVTGAYHFARAGSVTAEVNQFVRTVGYLSPGELVVLDWEVAAANPVAWCLAFLRAVRDTLGVRPLIYMNQHSRDSFNWSPVVAEDFGLWLAKYDFVTDQPPSGAWPTVAMKQFTDRGVVPGVAGGVDVNVFYGDNAALARYGAAAPQPSPTPAPVGEDDMKLNAYRVKGTAAVFAAGPGMWQWVRSNAELTTLQQSGTLGPVVDVADTDALDLIRGMWLSAVLNAPVHSSQDSRGDFTLAERLGAVDAATQELLARVPQPPTA